MKVWITKYALTKGIFEVDAKEGETSLTETPFVSWMGDYGKEYTFGKSWWRDRESAVIRARDMRDAKLKSLFKQIYKLEALEFK